MSSAHPHPAHAHAAVPNDRPDRSRVDPPNRCYLPPPSLPTPANELPAALIPRQPGPSGSGSCAHQSVHTLYPTLATWASAALTVRPDSASSRQSQAPATNVHLTLHSPVLQRRYDASARK